MFELLNIKKGYKMEDGIKQHLKCVSSELENRQATFLQHLGVFLIDFLVIVV